MAVGLYAPMLDRYPWVRRIKRDDWEFFLTVAFVFVALTQLNHEELPASRVDKLLDVVTDDLETWQKDALDAFEDCKGFYERGHDGLEGAYTGDQRRFLSADTIGMWVSWNLLKRAPQDDEVAIVRPVGTIAAHEFTAWWRM